MCLVMVLVIMILYIWMLICSVYLHNVSQLQVAHGSAVACQLKIRYKLNLYLALDRHVYFQDTWE